MYVCGCSSKCKVPIHTPVPQAIHTPWSIPMIHTPLEDMIHTCDPYPWSIPMIHTLAMASFGHVLIKFLSCTYWIPKVVFHAQRFEWGVRPSPQIGFWCHDWYGPSQLILTLGLLQSRFGAKYISFSQHASQEGIHVQCHHPPVSIWFAGGLGWMACASSNRSFRFRT